MQVFAFEAVQVRQEALKRLRQYTNLNDLVTGNKDNERLVDVAKNKIGEDFYVDPLKVDLDWRSLRHEQKALGQSHTTLYQLLRGVRDHIPDSPKHNQWINHAEIISKYAPDTFTGVRVSPDIINTEFAKPILDFAQRHNKPVFSWDSKYLDNTDHRKILSELLRTQDLGEWIPQNVGGNKAMVPSFFGQNNPLPYLLDF